MTRTQSDLLASEQSFFDREAEAIAESDLLSSPEQMRRYREARPRATNAAKDSLFAILQPLSGKRVLEYGCGAGENACHLADCGADVTAFDLSPISIRRARQRAAALGIADRIQFDVKAAGNTGYAPASFDIVFGSAILHHLHTQFDSIYPEISRLLTPTGVACFLEPVANSHALQWIRRHLPVACYATPDERQLTYADFDLLRSYGFARVTVEHFYCLDRLRRFVGEPSSPVLRWTDYYAQRLLPPLRRFYGQLLVIAYRQ